MYESSAGELDGWKECPWGAQELTRGSGVPCGGGSQGQRDSALGCTATAASTAGTLAARIPENGSESTVNCPPLQAAKSGGAAEQQQPRATTNASRRRRCSAWQGCREGRAGSERFPVHGRPAAGVPAASAVRACRSRGCVSPGGHGESRSPSAPGDTEQAGPRLFCQGHVASHRQVRRVVSPVQAGELKAVGEPGRFRADKRLASQTNTTVGGLG